MFAEGVIAGGAAGVVVEAALYPIDTIKTRLQVLFLFHGNRKKHFILRRTKGSSNDKYRVIYNCSSSFRLASLCGPLKLNN